MELRNAEKEIDGITELYKSLNPSAQYPLLKWDELLSLQGKKAQTDENDAGADEDKDENTATRMPMSAQDLLHQITKISTKMDEMKPLAAKFRQRMGMKDPVTNAPRYGQKTLTRVSTLLEKYDTLALAMDIAHGRHHGKEEELEGQNAVIEETFEPTAHCENAAPTLIQSLQNQVQSEEDAAIQEEYRKKQESQEQKDIEEQMRLEQEERRKRQELEEKLRLQREREDLHARSEAARLARIENERRMAEEERIAERAFLDSVPKGVDGVKEQLRVLRDSCSVKKDLDTALGALYTLFSQISARPEEIKFRRIRRDHPKFLEDIGRHSGGKEVLIAAGFTFAEVDGAKCFFSREPDLASDMDGWSEWFDLIKGTLAAIEEEMIK